MNKEEFDESDCTILSIIGHYLPSLMSQSELLHKLIAYIVQVSKVRLEFLFLDLKD